MDFTLTVDPAFWDFVTILMCGIVFLSIPIWYKIGSTSRKVNKRLDSIDLSLKIITSDVIKTRTRVGLVCTHINLSLDNEETPDNSDDADKE